jgi:FkbM family methyltransferase
VAPDLLKSILRKPLDLVGLEVHRRGIAPSDGYHIRGSRSGVLQHARNVGLLPRTVIDLGAAYGAFALECHSIFPDANYILVDPLEEYRTFLKAVSRSIPRAEYIAAAATATSGEVVIHVHPDLVGSSLYLEDEDSNVNGVPRTVPGIALESLLRDPGTIPPFLLNIDVQGAELDVLSGQRKFCRVRSMSFSKHPSSSSSEVGHNSMMS